MYFLRVPTFAKTFMWPFSFGLIQDHLRDCKFKTFFFFLNLSMWNISHLSHLIYGFSCTLPFVGHLWTRKARVIFYIGAHIYIAVYLLYILYCITYIPVLSLIYLTHRVYTSCTPSLGKEATRTSRIRNTGTCSAIARLLLHLLLIVPNSNRRGAHAFFHCKYTKMFQWPWYWYCDIVRIKAFLLQHKRKAHDALAQRVSSEEYKELKTLISILLFQFITLLTNTEQGFITAIDHWTLMPTIF